MVKRTDDTINTFVNFSSTGFPNLLAMSSSETTVHEPPLKAIKYRRTNKQHAGL
ncbi:MAG: hypothetical protein ACR2IS_02815 [Nitrososphaeraceae archaeon]